MKKIISIVGIVSALVFAACTNSNFKAKDLTVGESFQNPLGRDLSMLSFSWKLPDMGQDTAQSAYQIEVSQDKKIIWDTGKVKSAQSVKVPYEGRPLKSAEKMFWRVRFWDRNDTPSGWSEYASFETGLLVNSDWKGKWLSSPENLKTLYTYKLHGDQKNPPINRNGVPPAYLRKSFEVRDNLVSARLYVASRGIFEAYLNGEKVSDQYFGTGWTTYEKRVTSDAFDITSMLKKGENTIGAIIADGWYAGRIMRRDGSWTKPEFLAQVELTYADGSKEIIPTDASWKSSSGAYLYSDFYDGELYDARLEHSNFATNNFDASAWKNAVARNVEATPLITPRRNQPVKVCDVVEPVSVKEISDGVFIFDFAQNLVGVPLLHLKGEAGKTIKIRFAEMLNKDGTLYTENYRGAISTDYYIPRTNEVETYQPKFTFHGYRYLEVSGVAKGWKPTAKSVKSLVLHNDMPRTGTFKCSNKKINQLQSNIFWGQRSNYISVPTDCPQRDERMGWTGDAQVFIPTATFNMNVNAFFSKWNQDMRDIQTKDGMMAHVVPGKWGGGSPAWADACVICPWEIYLAYGDKKAIVENYEMMKKWVDFQKNTSKNLLRPEVGFGDWLQPSSTRGKDSNLWRGTTPRTLIGTAYFARTADIVAKCATLLGKKDDASYYAKLASDIRAEFIKSFVSEDGTVKSQAQTAYLLPLAFDILPQELAQKAFAKFLKVLEKNNCYLDTGFVGTPLLNPVLTKFGRMDLAYRIINNEGYPSWLYSINQGATTMWERWNSYSHENGFGEASMNSFNHYAYGAIGEWLYRDVAGIWHDENATGYKNIIFAPKFGGGLTFAEASLETSYGKAVSSWSKKDNKIVWKVTVPPNATGTLKIDASKIENVKINGKPAKSLVENVSSGTYEIQINL